MPTARRPLLALLLACAAASSGCSALFMRPPPRAVADPSAPLPACTTSVAAPAADVLVLALYSVAVVTRTGDDDLSPGLALAGDLVGTVLLTSAVGGFSAAGRCRDLRQLNTRCINDDRAACLELSPDSDPFRRPRTPPGCALDAECPPGQACVEAACVERLAPAAAPTRPAAGLPR